MVALKKIIGESSFLTLKVCSSDRAIKKNRKINDVLHRQRSIRANSLHDTTGKAKKFSANTNCLLIQNIFDFVNMRSDCVT